MPICLQNINPLLALYCHPNDPVAGTVLLPNQTTTVLHLQSNRPNDCADVPTIQQPIDKQAYHHPTLVLYCYLNLTTVAPIRLRPTDRMIIPIRLRLTDRLVNKLYTQPLSLPSLVPYYHLDRPLPYLQLIPI